MGLVYAGANLDDYNLLLTYKIKQGGIIERLKGRLKETDGLIISYDPDLITLDDSMKEPRAKMPCNHVISTSSMTDFLRRLLTTEHHTIRCPGRKADPRFQCDE